MYDTSLKKKGIFFMTDCQRIIQSYINIASRASRVTYHVYVIFHWMMSTTCRSLLVMLLKLWIRVKRRGMGDKTSPIPPTSSTAPLKMSSFNSRIKTSNIPSISSTASQKKSSCKSRAKTSKIPPTSYVPASPKDTSLNNTDNE